jgi:hypothetical protein
MGDVLGQVLGNVVGVALSPVPIIALILMLFSQAAARNGLAFLVGWVTGLLVVGVLVLLLGLEAGGGSGSGAGGVMKLLVGVAFLGLGLRQWRHRPRAGADPELPGWMATVEDFSAVKAAGLGVVLTAANPKNLGLTLAAAATIGAGGLSAGGEAAALVVFVLLSSLTVLAPVVYYLVAGDRADRALHLLKDWLTVNNSTVMTVLFLVLGAKVGGDGLATLL